MSSIIAGKPPIVIVAAGSLVKGQLRVFGYKFSNTGAATAGNVTVTDDSGNVLFHGVTTATQGSDSFFYPFKPIQIGGYQVTALSGTGAVLDIYAE